MLISSHQLGERFWSKVEKTENCWIWRASTGGANKYGRFRHNGRHHQAHRLALEESIGSHLPSDLHACHHCDTPTCVRPDHLFAATQQQNMDDRGRKGRAARCGNHKLNPIAIQVIRHFQGKGWGVQRRLARVYGINISTIRRIWRREMWPLVSSVGIPLTPATTSV